MSRKCLLFSPKKPSHTFGQSSAFLTTYQTFEKLKAKQVVEKNKNLKERRHAVLFDCNSRLLNVRNAALRLRCQCVDRSNMLNVHEPRRCDKRRRTIFLWRLCWRIPKCDGLYGKKLQQPRQVTWVRTICCAGFQKEKSDTWYTRFQRQDNALWVLLHLMWSRGSERRRETERQEGEREREAERGR